MKAWTTNPEQYDPALRLADGVARIMFIILMSAIIIILLCSCGSTRMVTQTVRDVSVDTVYLSNTQYDSIYIYKDRVIDRSKDTVYLKDISVEYRYKLLRDTIYKVQRDSIPYEVTVIKTKEIARPLTWYDHLSRAILWLNIGFVLLVIVRLIRKLRT